LPISAVNRNMPSLTSNTPISTSIFLPVAPRARVRQANP
jgi:hypothetical protein